MARTHLGNSDLRFPLCSKSRDKLKNKLDDHDTTLDALEAGTGKGTLLPLFTAGRNGAGAVTFTGAKVGDTVFSALNLTDVSDAMAATAVFESTITVADQIQQASASDLSAKKFHIILRRGS